MSELKHDIAVAIAYRIKENKSFIPNCVDIYASWALSNIECQGSLLWMMRKVALVKDSGLFAMFKIVPAVNPSRISTLLKAFALPEGVHYTIQDFIYV